jgi:hypothetical protein
MSTEQLLLRLQRLRECEPSLERSDRELHDVVAGQIMFKDNEEWEEAFQDVKTILATREHVERPKERTPARRQRVLRERGKGRKDR